jgi:hypothetical protein
MPTAHEWFLFSQTAGSISSSPEARPKSSDYASYKTAHVLFFLPLSD